MITAIVLFPMDETETVETAAAKFRESAPRYVDRPGLLRKAYIFDPEARRGGSCFILADRAAADAMFNAEWRDFVTAKYGAPPDLTIYESPVTVDNVAGVIIDDYASSNA